MTEALRSHLSARTKPESAQAFSGVRAVCLPIYGLFYGLATYSR